MILLPPYAHPFMGDLLCYYEVPGQTLQVIILQLTVVQSDRQQILQGNISQLYTAQPEDVVEKIIKRFLTGSLIFVCLFLFGIPKHNILTDIIYFNIYLTAPTWRTSVFFYTYNTSVNISINFLALGFLIGTGGPGDIVLL